MRIKKRTTDFGAISRSSVKRDFQRVQTYPKEEKRPEIEDLPKINAERRIIHISETSGYAKFARYIVLNEILTYSDMEQKFENQGKRPDQLESANRLAGYSFICAIVLIILYAIWNAVQ